MEVTSERQFIIGIIFFLFVANINRLISMIFVLNFSTSGLNNTVTISLLFLLPAFTLPIFGKFTQEKFELLFGLAILIQTLLSPFVTAAIRAILAALNLTILNLLLIHYSKENTEEIINGLIIGFTLLWTFGIVFVGINPYSTSYSQIVMYLSIIILVFLMYRNPQNIASSYNLQFVNIILIFMVYCSTLLSNSFIFVSWALSPYFSIFGLFSSNILVQQTLLSGLLGIIGILTLFGLYQFRLEININRMYVYIILIGTTSTFVIFPFLVPIMLVLHLIALFVTLDQLSSVDHLDASQIKYGLTLFSLLLLIFMQTISGHWAFLPSIIHPIIKGMAGIYILGMVCFLIGSIELTLRGDINE